MGKRTNHCMSCSVCPQTVLVSSLSTLTFFKSYATLTKRSDTLLVMGLGNVVRFVCTTSLLLFCKSSQVKVHVLSEDSHWSNSYGNFSLPLAPHLSALLYIFC